MASQLRTSLILFAVHFWPLTMCPKDMVRKFSVMYYI
jgi:hypothetical protein